MKDFQSKTTQVKNGSWTVFGGLCKGCGICLEKCPLKALIFSKDKGVTNQPVPRVNKEKCNLCQICENNCPELAIRVDKKS